MTACPARLPEPRTPDPMAAPALRWGVMGTGWIAERFVPSLHRHTRQRVLAVGSRDADRAIEFGGRFGVPRTHSSYEALVADPDVDVVYVATPHPMHHPCALLALQAGKHVLIEKPLAVNADQAAEIAEFARSRNLFCMEALWSFFLPKFDVVRQILDYGMLGEIHTVNAEHGEHFGPEHRIMRPELAGGPLLDLGTYPIALAVWTLGKPERVLASGQPAPSGVNGQAAAILSGPAGRLAVLHTTLFSNTPTTATIAGTAATLTMSGPFSLPGDFTVTSSDGSATLSFTEAPIGHDGLHYQAAEVARCIAAGRRESPIRPLADSITTMTVLDEIRRQIGVTFSRSMPA